MWIIELPGPLFWCDPGDPAWRTDLRRAHRFTDKAQAENVAREVGGRVLEVGNIVDV